MTNKEYLISQLGFTPSNDFSPVDAAIIDTGLIASTSYIKENRPVLVGAVLQVIDILLSTPDTETGSDETRLSVKFDRGALIKRRAFIQKELGIIDPSRRTIKALSVW